MRPAASHSATSARRASLVSGGRDGHAVAEPDEAALLLEKERELRVLDLHGFDPELRLELCGRPLALAERCRRPGPVELCAPALESEQRHDRDRPRLGRRVDAGIERIGLVEPALELGAQLVEPIAGEEPVAGALDAGRVAVEHVPHVVEPDGRIDRGRDVAALDPLDPLGARVARRGGVEDSSAAERRLAAQHDAVAPGRHGRGREPELRRVVADPADGRGDLGRAVVDVDAGTVPDRLQLLERDVEAVADGIGARSDQRLAAVQPLPARHRGG